MANKSCGTCAAWHPTAEGNGECRLTPPQTIFMGFQPPRLTGQPPQPIIAAAFPAAQATAYCHQWTPAPVEMTTGIGWRQTEFIEGEGIVTREIPAADVVKSSNIHTPVKRYDEWECERCGAHEDVFDMVPCKEKSDAAT